MLQRQNYQQKHGFNHIYFSLSPKAEAMGIEKDRFEMDSRGEIFGSKVSRIIIQESLLLFFKFKIETNSATCRNLCY